MATTSDYLNQLKQDKSNLVSNLNTKGVTASNEETFTSLVPKVLDIQSGGEDFEITDASYLFIMGGRLDIEDLLLSKLYKPISLYGMYAGAKKETIDLSNIDLSECTSLERCFASYSTYSGNMSGDNTLKNIIIGQNVPKLETLSYAFGYRDALHNLNLSCINLPNNFISFSNCFYGSTIYGTLSLPICKTANVSNMFSRTKIFAETGEMGSLDLSNIDLSECTSLSQMFYNCDIETIIHTNFDCSSVIGCSNIFTSNNKLVNLCALKNLGKGYTQKTNNYSNYRLILQDCSNLTHDSLMNIINGLYDLNLTYDVANGGTLYTQSLILGETNLAKLTETEIAVATNKGWAVS